MTTDKKKSDEPSDPKSNEGEKDETPRKKRSWRTVLRTAGIVLLILLTISAVGIGSAEYYTARPDFCGSCHIMDPYYKSWHADIHGARLDVRCVDCHYAPGQQHTFMAKFKGLSQAASYFSGRAGGARPRAHVNDASCMRSKCHGDGGHFDKILLIGDIHTEKRIVGGHEIEIERKPTVRFVHAKHRNVEHRQEETDDRIAEATKTLKSQLDATSFEKIDAISRSVGPAAARKEEMRNSLRQFGAEAAEGPALELMRLRHMRVRLDQLAGLTCAACHTYDATGNHHFAVDRQTCFTCHFTNQQFNRDTGACLKCHEAPTRGILVHEESDALAASTQAGTAASMMDHRDIVERGIDCASCHFDVVRGESRVTKGNCTHCHDQERFLAEFAERTTETVAEYHRIHVATQRARCTDCHHAIEHNLVNPTAVGTSADFLRPVLDDCQHCHPNHHHEQVELLMGVGGRGSTRPMPNAMFGSRVNCRGCHSEAGRDAKGDAAVKATEKTCTVCHSQDYQTLFRQWQSELSSALEESQAAMKRVTAQIESRRAAGRDIPAHIESLIADARANIQFVRAGNGVHNKNYAIHLLDLANQNLDEAVVALASDRAD